MGHKILCPYGQCVYVWKRARVFLLHHAVVVRDAADVREWDTKFCVPTCNAFLVWVMSNVGTQHFVSLHSHFLIEQGCCFDAGVEVVQVEVLVG